MENPVTPDGINQSTSEAVPAAPEPVAEPAPSAYAQPGAVLVIPRVFLNYVVIAVIFLAIGLVIGGASVNALFNANSMENKALIDEAAKTIAQAIGGSGTHRVRSPRLRARNIRHHPGSGRWSHFRNESGRAL